MTDTRNESAEYFEGRRGDLSEWSEVPSKANVRPGGSVVFSVRFAREELDLLRDRAAASGKTISEFVRRAALTEASEGRPIVYYSVAGDPQTFRFTLEAEPSTGDDQFTETLPFVNAS